MEVNVSVLYKILSYFKTLLWKNNKIIYINSNKKIQCKDNIDSLTKTNDYQWVICQFSYKGKFNFNNYKIHFFKMRKHLYDISRNSKNFNELTYSGFVSPMFAVFDGYILGDNKKYCFIDCGSDDSHPYKINYSKNNKKTKVSNKPSTDIVNVIFACSFDINNIDDQNDKYIFSAKSGDKVSKKYLQDVFNFAKNVFDICRNVKRINLFVAAKQPVSFIIGTAIQSYHPLIYAYELINGEYKFSLCIQTGKLEEKKYG